MQQPNSSLTTNRKPPHRLLFMGSLILAGESIYMLPYLRKSFQTSMEATFGLSSFEVGTLNALFGILALVCYLPGGLLAVHAFWGVFSILTFWAALIKAVRLWSGPGDQGRAFGVLDGGRGVVGAGLGSIAALCFGLSGTVEAGLVAVIRVYSAASILAGVAIWFAVPDDHEKFSGQPHADGRLHVLDSIAQTLSRTEVWLIAMIIFCAYFSFLGTYEFPAYAERGFERSKEFGAWLGAFRDWLRPAAAVVAGIIADRFSASKAIRAAFVVLMLSYATLWLVPPALTPIAVLWAQVSATALAVFALRGIYFALLEESRIPMHLTGIAVGTISMIAYTPDIFAPLLAGWLVDSSPGVLGYQRFFGLMAAIAAIGFAATIVMTIVIRRGDPQTQGL